MLSQVRGPFCAKRFMARLSLLEMDEEEEGDANDSNKGGGEGNANTKTAAEQEEQAGAAPVRPRVCVLRHGYQNWYRMYRREIGMVVPCDVEDDDEDDEEEDDD